MEHDFQRRAALLWGAFVLPEPLSLASLASSPSRGASGETGNFVRTAKASPIRGGGTPSGVTEGFNFQKEEPTMKSQALKGMRDLLPAEQTLRDYIQGKIL